jgi:hypothetical protein
MCSYELFSESRAPRTSANFHPRDCPTTSLDMRQRIWGEYRQKRRDKNNTPSANKVRKSDTAHSRQHNSPPNQHNHGNVASLKTDAAIAPATCDFTEYSMTSRRPERANAVRHKATKAEWRTTVHSHDQNPPTPIEPPRPPTQERSELVTSVTDWLIDSGATAHMTPSKEDFNGTLTPFDSIVETANGGIIRVTHRGTVRILMCDIFRPDNTIVVKLHNVLFVPGLTKRLLSVPEWNSYNGQIYHMIDRQRVEIFDDNREICAFIDLPPCPGATEGVELIHAVSQRQEMRAGSGTPTKIPQSLMHRRLGHRSIASLMMADQDILWADVTMIPDKDEFCETCQITLSRKANKGKATNAR